MKIPFGKYKNKNMEKLPRSYLEWLVNNLMDGELHKYAIEANKILQSPAVEMEMQTEDLDKLATEWLKERGYSKNGKRI